MMMMMMMMVEEKEEQDRPSDGLPPVSYRTLTHCCTCLCDQLRLGRIAMPRPTVSNTLQLHAVMY